MKEPEQETWADSVLLSHNINNNQGIMCRSEGGTEENILETEIILDDNTSVHEISQT